MDNQSGSLNSATNNNNPPPPNPNVQSPGQFTPLFTTSSGASSGSSMPGSSGTGATWSPSPAPAATPTPGPTSTTASVPTTNINHQLQSLLNTANQAAVGLELAINAYKSKPKVPTGSGVTIGDGYAVVVQHASAVNNATANQPNCIHIGILGDHHIDVIGQGIVRCETEKPPVAGLARRRIFFNNGSSILITLYPENIKSCARYSVEFEANQENNTANCRQTRSRGESGGRSGSRSPRRGSRGGRSGSRGRGGSPRSPKC